MSILNFSPKKTNHIIGDMNAVTKDQRKALEKMRPMIATPIRGTTVMGNYDLSMQSLAKWAARVGMDIDSRMLMGCSYIEQGRNVLANTFWDSKCTHLVFIDSDIGFMTNSFFELLLTGKDVVGGVYTKRKINWQAVENAVKAGIPTEMLAHCSGEFPMHCLEGEGVTIGHEPQKVLTLPSGFMSISRKALETYVKAHPERKTTPGNPGHYGIEFFKAGTMDQAEKDGSVTRGFDSEDNVFCKDMYRLGVNTWVCPWIHLSHSGEHVFEACLPCSQGAYVHWKPWMEKQAK